VQNIVDFASQGYFYSKGGRNQWVCLAFKAERVRPTHYSLESGGGVSHLANWVLEGSDGGDRWVELDRQKQNTALKQKHQTASFPIRVPQEVGKLRLRQIGKSHDRDDILLIGKIEVFGDFIPESTE
jgi:hypothetical protein